MTRRKGSVLPHQRGAVKTGRWLGRVTLGYDQRTQRAVVICKTFTEREHAEAWVNRELARGEDRSEQRARRRTQFQSRWKSRMAELGQLECAVCGWSGGTSINAHHIVPVAAGGKDVPENLILLCPNHHAEAHRRYPMAEYRRGGNVPQTRDAIVADLRVPEIELQKRAAERFDALISGRV